MIRLVPLLLLLAALAPSSGWSAPEPGQEGSEAAPADTLGYISINAKPWARVWIDGTFVQDTPLVRYELPAGDHSITLDVPALGKQVSFPMTVLPEHHVKEVHRFQGGTWDLRRTVEAAGLEGSLNLDTEPAGEVYVDDTLIGATPIKDYTIDTGKHHIRLQCSSCSKPTAISFTVDILSGQTIRQRHRFPQRGNKPSQSQTPQAPGYLHINSMPWSKVSVDGVYLRDTPLVGYEVAPGEHRIVLERPGYGEQVEFIVDVRPGQTVKQVFTLSEFGSPPK